MIYSIPNIQSEHTFVIQKLLFCGPLWGVDYHFLLEVYKDKTLFIMLQYDFLSPHCVTFAHLVKK